MSNEINDGGPAFPFATIDGHLCVGMTLRDYFAAQALSGMLGGAPGSHLRPDNAARVAYQYADAMVKERAR